MYGAGVRFFQSLFKRAVNKNRADLSASATTAATATAIATTAATAAAIATAATTATAVSTATTVAATTSATTAIAAATTVATTFFAATFPTIAAFPAFTATSTAVVATAPCSSFIPTIAAGTLGCRKWRQFTFLEHFTFEQPHFDSDFSIDRLGFYPCIVNVGTKGVERRASFFVFFGTGNFSAAQTTACTDFDAFGACTHRTLYGAFHSAAKVDTGFDLFGDLLADNVGVEFGLTDFEDVDLHLFAREHFQFFLDEVNFLTAFADDDTGAAGVDSDGNALHGALDDDSADAVLHRLVALTRVGRCRFRTTGAEVVADFFILYHFETIVFVGVPVGVPTANNA
jgi:hypothetical protein